METTDTKRVLTVKLMLFTTIIFTDCGLLLRKFKSKYSLWNQELLSGPMITAYDYISRNIFFLLFWKVAQDLI